MSDAWAILSWWLIIQALGLAAWPLAFRLLRWLPDRGYMLAKPLGLLLTSYFFWLAVSFHILPNTSLGILAAFVFVVAISWGLYCRERSSLISILSWLRDHYRLMIAYELLFALAFIGWSVFRAYSPDISSAEKPMEMAFFNAASRSASFPPYDPWLSGYPILYYYFGYVMMSVLSRVSGVTSGVAFSLSNALWFALSAASAFAIVTDLILLSVRRLKIAVAFGVLASVLLMVIGNLEAPLEVAYTKGWGTADLWTWLDIVELNQPYTPAANDRPSWLPRAEWDWWWRAARLIHDYPPTNISPQMASVLGKAPDANTNEQEVISDFPQFSFILGDLHAYMLNLPFVLLAIGLALNLYQAGARGEATALWHGDNRAPLALLYPFVVGSSVFLNTWDLPIYLALSAAAWGLGQWQARRLRLRENLGNLMILGLLSALFYLPYYLQQNFAAQVSGIIPNTFNGTRLTHFFLMFGPFIVIGLLFGIGLLIESVQTGRLRLRRFLAQALGGGIVLTAGLIAAAGILGVVAFQLFVPFRRWFEDLLAVMAQRGITLEAHLLTRLSDPWVPLLLASAFLAILMFWRVRRPIASPLPSIGNDLTSLPPTNFVLLLFAAGVLLALSTEFVFVFDSFPARTNTVTKFYYQVWVVWSVAAAYAVYHMLFSPSRLKSTISRILAGVAIAGTIGLGLVYPLLAVPSRTTPTVEPTLDAMLATTRSPAYPGTDKAYAAVQWLDQNSVGTPVILQAMTADSLYRTSFARISSWTGLPTVLGWPHHEIQWRGASQMLQQRLTDIDTIYATTDPAIALALLHQYNVQYVYVGSVEHKTVSCRRIGQVRADDARCFSVCGHDDISYARGNFSMNFSDLSALFSWWLILQVVGLAAWPLAFRWLRWLPDRGYMLSKPLGLLLVSYFFWLLVSLHILPNTTGGILLASAAVVGASALFYAWHRRPTSRAASQAASPSLWAWLLEHRWLVIAYEIVFALAFLAWALFRAHAPDIITGEKPMELAFLNAINRSASFPPYDPWLSGYPIAYYYFGYVMMSVLQRISSVSAGVAFSLSNALWYALSAAGAFGVVADLVLLAQQSARRAAIFFGVLGAVLLVLAGNFEAPLEVAYAGNQGPDELWQQLDILDLNQPRTSSLSWPPRETWWWRASRVIHDYPPDSISPRLSNITGQPADANTVFQETITEFPQFSFLLGDMHPHVLNLPFVLMCFGLALNLYQAARVGKARSVWQTPSWFLYPLALGALGFTNTWDFPIYAFMTLSAVALGAWQEKQLRWRDRFADLLLLGIPGILLYLPFYLNFTSQASGLGPNPFNGTQAGHFFIVFGPLLIINAAFGLKLVLEAHRTGQVHLRTFVLKVLGGGLALTLAAGLALLALTAYTLSHPAAPPDIQAGLADPFAQRFSLSLGETYRAAFAWLNDHGISAGALVLTRLSDPWLPLILGSSLCAIVLLWRAQFAPSADRPSAETSPRAFVLLLLGVGLLLALSVEFVFIVDLFKTRMNTLFKFYFQVWALWSIVGAYGLFDLLVGPRHILSKALRIGVGSVAAVTLGLGLLYPALALPTHTQELNVTTPTLDGILAAAQSPQYPNVPAFYAAVTKFTQQVAGAPVILEAADDDFLYRAGRSRFSSWTGLPTPLGWYWHEMQWRGNDVILRQRLPDVTTIYSTTDKAAAQSLLQRYNVEYIIVSGRERKQYPAEGVAKFDQMFPVVFQQDNLTIYQVTTDSAASTP